MNELGRYGVWTAAPDWPATTDEIAAAAVELETLGYGSVWLGGLATDDPTSDDLALPEAILAATTTLTVGTSIIDIWKSDPAVLNAGHERLRSRFPGRFYLGLGSGHAPVVEAAGQRYVRPLSKLREFAASLSTPADERMFAALGPKTLAAAREMTAGALPYLTPPAHTAQAREILGPDRLLIPEQKVFLGADPATARAAAQAATTLALSLPNYRNNLRRFGMTDADFAAEGSDRLLGTLVVWGEDEAIRAGVQAHLDAGADQVALQLVQAPGATGLPRAAWRAAAQLFLGQTTDRGFLRPVPRGEGIR